MDKKRLALLEKAYGAEVSAAIAGSQIHIIQTKSALAEIMVEEGYLAKRKLTFSGVSVEGYELTHAGRMTYCMSCPEGNY